MATTYRATINFNVWKQHTCVHCNAKYRYLLQRKITGTGGTEQAASNAAEANVLRAITTEVNMQPCPTCGLYQPDMVGAKRKSEQLYVFIAFVVACAIPIITGFVTDWAWYVPFLAAGVAGLALIAHLLVDAGNPNGKPQANLETARERVEKGEIYTTTAGDSGVAGNEATGAAWRPAGQAVLYLLFIVGMLAIPVSQGIRLIKGWPMNSAWRPHIVGPGDKAYVYFPNKISSVKGYWSAAGVATVANADQLGVPAELKLTSQGNTWGDSISVKSSEKNTSSTIWAQVELPQDPKLAGKSLKVTIVMLVSYPEVKGLGFENTQLPVSQTVDLVVAGEAKAGAIYSQSYWFGLFGGLAMTLFVSGLITVRAGSVRSQALPTEIHTPTSDGEDRSPKSESIQ
jgi:hypothetical protein